VEVFNDSTENVASDSAKTLTVEIFGEVINPGVYKLPDGSRVDDLLIVAGGFSSSADRVWADKYLNRAAKITDGQKVYIPLSVSSPAPRLPVVGEGIKLYHQQIHPIVMV